MLPLTPKSGWRYRAQQVLSSLRFLYHWGFIPGLIVLGMSNFVIFLITIQQHNFLFNLASFNFHSFIFGVSYFFAGVHYGHDIDGPRLTFAKY